MGFLGWTALIGVVLLTMALSSAYLRRLPVSSALVYLLLGVAIGPLGAGLLRIELDADWLERLTEFAVTVSLFFGGLKLRLPLRDAAWRAVFRLAGPLMLATMIAVALFAHLVLQLSIASALVIGAVLAPTDPVLASAVSVNDAADHDRVRFGLSGEAGLNDGMAFPFLLFALEWAARNGAGDWMLGWALHRVVWAVPAALVVGYVLGRAAGLLAITLRTRSRDTRAPSDFLALALIALAYAGAQAVSAWAFLAVFAAGVGLRRAEIDVVKRTPHPEHDRSTAGSHPPAEMLAAANAEPESLDHPAVAAGAVVYETISFGDTAERLLEVLLVVLLGASLYAFDLRALALAFALFLLIRPALTLAVLAGTETTTPQRLLIGWFGIRGIGSIYYLCYALSHGGGEAGDELAGIVLPVLALSVVVHGATAQPVLARYERRLAQAHAG
jgi:NhaP-type Na+/H+ or K+/H+ antiporter